MLRYANAFYADLDTMVDQALNPDDATDSAAFDRMMYGFLLAASNLVAQYTGRTFVPVYQTRVFDALGDHINTRSLTVDADLLSVTTLTNGDGTTITADKFRLFPANAYPKGGIDLLLSGGTWTYSTDYEGAISVAGEWGYHETGDYWLDTLDTIQDAGGISVAATTITVSDADGTGSDWRLRFRRGLYIKAESEVMLVTDIDTTTNVITVRRAQLGTTAATHAQTTVLYNLMVLPDVEQTTLGLAIWLYRNRETQGEKLQFLDGSTIISNQAPYYIKQTLERYMWTGVG